MTGTLHLVMLCVGADGVVDHLAWQAVVAVSNAAAGRPARPTHVTRMWPRRAEELLDGGSLYWVFRGLVLGRQRILGLDARDGTDGIRRCAIALDPEVVRTRPMPRRPFQGWRYLPAQDAPRDLPPDGAALPAGLMAELADLGVL